MYRCKDCGNTEEFYAFLNYRVLGLVDGEKKVISIQDKLTNPDVEEPNACAYCGSTNIKE